MLATRTPSAPIVAFMVAFPLTGPEELVLSGGLFGWPLDLIFFTGAITLGLAAGRGDRPARAPRLARRQARMRSAERPHNACPTPAHAADPDPPAENGSAPVTVRTPVAARLRLAELPRELAGPGPGVVLPRLQRHRVPAHRAADGRIAHRHARRALTRLHRPRGRPGHTGLITTEALLPMVAALIHGGLGLGPAMAFLVTGAFVIALVALLFAGALVLGGLTGAILG